MQKCDCARFYESKIKTEKRTKWNNWEKKSRILYFFQKKNAMWKIPGQNWWFSGIILSILWKMSIFSFKLIQSMVFQTKVMKSKYENVYNVFLRINNSAPDATCTAIRTLAYIYDVINVASNGIDDRSAYVSNERPWKQNFNQYDMVARIASM